MKNKITIRLISSLLTVLLVFSVFATVLPQKASAAYSAASFSSASKSKEEIQEIVKNAFSYGSATTVTINETEYSLDFKTTEQAWQFEQQLGYLDSVSSTDGRYTIYVNRYTGVMYYRNNLTGQILSSNPYDPSCGSSDSTARELLSQLSISFTPVGENEVEYNSTQWAAEYAQISTSKIENGIRVNYTLGDTTTRFFLPGRITAESFNNCLLLPMISSFTELMKNYCTAIVNNPTAIKEYCISHYGLNAALANEIRKDTLDEETLDQLFADGSKYLKKNTDLDAEKKEELKFLLTLTFDPHALDELDFLDGVTEDGLSKSGRYQVYYDNYVTEEKTVKILNTSARVTTRSFMNDTSVSYNPGLKKYFENMQLIFNMLQDAGSAAYDLYNLTAFNELNELRGDVLSIITKYTLINLKQFENIKGEAYQKQKEEYLETYYSDSSLEISATYEPFYVCNLNQNLTEEVTAVRNLSSIFSQYVQDYTFSMMYSEEKALGYEDETAQKPVFRCALEYRFNDDDSLSVSLPANSLSFDESKYTLNSIAPLKYFGAGNIRNEGSLFFPDGSGTIIDFDEFSQSKIAIVGSGDVFGSDNTYYTITGTHHEQISMPVYGVTNRVTTAQKTLDGSYTTASTMMSGYFAILEEGASLASLTYQTGGSAHKYATVYASFTPYPSDTCELAVTGGSYTIVSDSKYNGSYVTAYKMLTDDTVGAKYSAELAASSATEGSGMQNYYPATYSGMAAYYRDYLVQKGILSALTDTSDDLPLYIEALGSMEIQDKFLTFPITKKIALTTFEDVETMYTELEAQGITNINFRLTGFANGGMSDTYPTRVKWVRCVGGKRGFRNLLKTANAKNAEEGKTFGVYPEFDFLYIHEQESFDGISLKGNVSRMVDNRYASKHSVSSSTGETENSYTMVITPDVLDKLYSKFLKKYSKYDVSTLSVSTLGSDLNSNFDEDQSVNRDEAQNYVTSLLSRMTSEDHYTLMADMGNIYAVKYMTHLLNVSTDSSHFRYSSYTVPFVGMVLHGFVNYAGSPINYAGTMEYELLRSIESGSSLYYILCMQNSAEMKDDSELSQYYGVDYVNWKESIVETYNELNTLLKDYQTWNITDHRVILGERVIEDSEKTENYETLKNEFLTMVSDQISAAVNAKIKELRDGGMASKKIGVSVNETELLGVLADELDLNETERAVVLDQAYIEKLAALVKTFTDEYDGSDPDALVSFGKNEFVYDSDYSYITESEATASDYEKTDYTSDLNNIVLVTYSNGTDSVQFILNYNIYAVEVKIDGKNYSISKFGYAIVKND